MPGRYGRGGEGRCGEVCWGDMGGEGWWGGEVCWGDMGGEGWGGVVRCAGEIWEGRGGGVGIDLLYSSACSCLFAHN